MMTWRKMKSPIKKHFWHEKSIICQCFHFYSSNFNFLLLVVSHNIFIHQFVIDFFLLFYPWTLLLLFLCSNLSFHFPHHIQIHNVACNWHEQMWKSFFLFILCVCGEYLNGHTWLLTFSIGKMDIYMSHNNIFVHNNNQEGEQISMNCADKKKNFLLTQQTD